MTQQKSRSDDQSPVFQAGIVYPDGRAALVFTPRWGLPRHEAEAIARTYKETAEAEGGKVEIHVLAGYPTPALIDLQLGLAEASLERRTGRKFVLTFFGGVLSARRDGGFHAAAALPRTPPQTFRRSQDEAVGSDAEPPAGERDRLSFKFRVENAVSAFVRGHNEQAA